ncbi:MAG: hypothetical protein Q4C25_06955, partial [Bacillota bacterium]|nr:hypothetical protein [Bacillota bacterium]
MRGSITMRKKMAAVAMAVIFAITSVCGSLMARTDESHGNVIVDWAVSKALDATFSILNAEFLSSIGYLSDNTENEALKDVCKFITATDNLLFAGYAQDSSRKIMAELKEIQGQLDNIDSHITDTLYSIQYYQTSENFQQMQSRINGYYVSYSAIMDTYENYINAADTYSQAVLDGTGEDSARINMNAAKEELEEYFNDSEFMTRLMADLKGDFNSDKDILESMVSMTCKYYPSDKANPDKDGNYNKGTKNRETTYMYEAWTTFDLSMPFDHQKYDGMVTAANNCARTYEMMMRVARTWYDYQYAINADNLDDDAVATQMKKNADNYAKVMNLSINALSDISQQCDDYVADLMRPYDTEVTKEMVYQSSGEHSFWFNEWKYLIIPVYKSYTTEAVNSRENMDFYRVGVNGTPYLLLKDIDGKGVANNVRDNAYLLKSNLGGKPTYGPSQDFYNLQRTADGSYTAPEDYTGVLPVINTNAYNGSGYDLTNYFVNMGNLDKLPSGNVSYVVTRELDFGGTEDLWNWNFHVDARWCSTKITPTHTESARVKMNFAEGYTSTDKVYNLLVGNKNTKEKSDVWVKLSDNRGTLAVTDSEGKEINNKVEAGTELTLTLTLKEGAALDNLRAVMANGESVDLANEESLTLKQQNEDGSYTFTFRMPYQKCTFRADFKPADKGESDEENPYLISSEQDLKDYLELASKEDSAEKYNSAHYKLTADISVGSLSHLFGETTEEGFTGVFDGNGHTISYVPLSGFFERVGESGVVKDLNLEVSGDHRTACYLVNSNAGTIDGCSIVGDGRKETVENSTNTHVGMLVWRNEATGLIRNCSNSLSV